MQRYKIRSLGKKYGLDDDSLYSYDPNTRAVRYDGRLLTIADDEVGGVSYKNSEKDFLSDVYDWHKSGGDELVAVRDYVTTNGSKKGKTAPKVDFESSDGRVLIGGTSLKPSFISEDGRAYAPKSEVDAILRRLTPERPSYENAYSGKIARAESRLEDNEFEFDLETDPVYLALREQYEREGNRALEDTTGKLAALTGGRISSAAITAGTQARMQYAKKLTDSIPELYEAAYDRYADTRDADARYLDRLDKLEAESYDRYLKKLDQYNKEIENANASAEYREEQPARETEHQLNKVKLDAATAETYQQKAMTRGYYTPEEAAYFGVSETTSPWSSELKRLGEMSDQEFNDYIKKKNFDKATEKELILYREESAKREAEYKAALDRQTATRSASSSANSSENKLLTTREAQNRLNLIMIGDAEPGLPTLEAVRTAIETRYAELLEIGVRYGMTYAEARAFLDETHDIVLARILEETSRGDDSYLLFGGTQWIGSR